MAWHSSATEPSPPTHTTLRDEEEEENWSGRVSPLYPAGGGVLLQDHRGLDHFLWSKVLKLLETANSKLQNKDLYIIIIIIYKCSLSYM